MSKTAFKSEAEFFDATLGAIDDIAAAQRKRIVQLLEPWTRDAELDKAFDAYAARVKKFAGAQSAPHHNPDPLALGRADAQQRLIWSAILKRFGGRPHQLLPEEVAASRALTTGSTPGSSWVPEEAADLVFDALPAYGDFSTLGPFTISVGKKKFAKCTGLPTGTYVMPSGQGTAPDPDTSLNGEAISLEANSLTVLIEASLDVLEDPDVDLGLVLPEKMSRGIARDVDRVAFNGNGASDGDNGGQVGIFQHEDVDANSATGGHTTFAQLDIDDLLAPVETVLGKGIRVPGLQYWAHPSFLPPLLRKKDGGQPLLRSPAETGAGWFLCGFPITFTWGAPSTDSAGAKVLAFGFGPAYGVGIVRRLEIASSGHAEFQNALSQIRAILRVRCEMIDPDAFATLALAAS